MILPEFRAASLGLKCYGALTWALTPVVSWHLRRRLKKGKELPGRWREKMGYASLARPKGPLLWLHAVGLGEALALRGVIAMIQDQNPTVNFLVTTGTSSAAKALEGQWPERAFHQFLPLDNSIFIKRFLRHWHPDLVVWSEQDLWPLLVLEVDKQGIPQALVNARMHERSFKKRMRIRSIYSDLLRRMSLISAQDAATLQHLQRLGAGDVRLDGSIKPANTPLPVNEKLQASLRQTGKKIWLLASSYAEDEAVVLTAYQKIISDQKNLSLVIAPRDIARAEQIKATCVAKGLSCSIGAEASALSQVHIIDQFGKLGTWYSVAEHVIIGGSFTQIQGHNPWEAVQLGHRVFHGPNIANFKADYELLHHNNFAKCVVDAPSLLEELQQKPDSHAHERRQRLLKEQREKVQHLVSSFCALSSKLTDL